MLTIEAKTTMVVACILKKKDKILISSRPEQKEFSGFYEFPGGKVKKKNFFWTALKRELYEELSIKINLSKVIFFKSYSIKRKKKEIILNFFICDNWFGNIKSMEKQDFKWTTIKSLCNQNMLKSNKRIIEYLNINFGLSTN